MTDDQPPDEDQPRVVVAQILGRQQRALAERVATANQPGNLEGLFAYDVLSEQLDFPLVLNVNPATLTWLADNTSRLGHTSSLSALGYGMRHFGATAPPAVGTTFHDGLVRLRLRDAFPEDRVSFAFNPVMFLGLALGVIELGPLGQDARAWLAAVITDTRCSPSTPFHGLINGYIRYVLTGRSIVVDDLSIHHEIDALALIEWAARRQALRLTDPRVDLSILQSRVLRQAAVADAADLTAAHAALIWSAVDASLQRSVDELVLSRSHVAAILDRFEAAMRRWRWDDPVVVNHAIRWEIGAEREVQDILWLILRSIFEDVVDEETLPRVGHSSYRADFGVPSLRLLIEVKYARKAGDFKVLEKEIMEDSIAYLVETRDRYQRLLVFIYDASGSVQEHALTAATLRKIPGIADVIVVSRPSQLPVGESVESGPRHPARQPGRGASRTNQAEDSSTAQ